jgi:hypothetical protein
MLQAILNRHTSALRECDVIRLFWIAEEVQILRERDTVVGVTYMAYLVHVTVGCFIVLF